MKHAYKEILFGKKKYILIEILLILLMFMVLFLSGLAEGLGRAVTSAIENMDADHFIIDDSAEQLITVSSIETEDFDTVASIAGANAAPLDIQRMYIKKAGEDEKINMTYFAVKPGSFTEPSVFEGTGLSESSAPNPILLDDDYKLEGIELNDKVYDSSTDIEFTVAGFVDDEMYGHTSVGFISTESYTALREALSPMYTPKYHTIAIKGDFDESALPKGLELVPKQEVIESIPSYSAEHTTITMIVWVLVVVSAVIIGIFNYILTLQKRRQFGIMKAIGMTGGELAGIIVSEVCIISVFAAVISLALTFAMAAGLPETMPFYLTVTNAVTATAVFVVVSIFSSLLSIVNISRIDPVTVIGGGEE
ncbi:MAG: ABC transporter permease [Lachnospiraceae bacterium]|nr:ABC transporter permease [Lachnospiraceae bacterium]